MKVKCATCSNELERKCIVKKETVNPNKKRICDLYVHDPVRVKIKQVLPTTQATPEMIGKSKPKYARRIVQQPVENTAGKPEAHPLTGDLSRFKSSAPRGG